MDDFIIFQEDHENGSLLSGNSLLTNSSSTLTFDQSLYSNDIISTFNNTPVDNNNTFNAAGTNNINHITNNISTLNDFNNFTQQQIQLQNLTDYNQLHLQQLQQQQQHLYQQQQQVQYQQQFNQQYQIEQQQQQQVQYQQQLSDYSSPEVFSSPISEPLTPNQLQTSAITHSSSPDQVMQSVPSPQTVSSDCEKTEKIKKTKEPKSTSSASSSSNITGKKRKNGFDPYVDQGPDLGSILLEISSEDFKIYKKNFYSGSNLSKHAQNLINSQYRKIKNRESAQRSREKKTKYTGEIEGELEKANQEIEQLKQENKRLKMENDLLRKQNDIYQTSFPSRYQEQQQFGGNNSFTGLLSNVFSSIGSSSSVNSKKVLCVFIFAIVLCGFIINNPNFTAQQQQQHQQASMGSTSFGQPYTQQISNSYVSGNSHPLSGRSPLSDQSFDSRNIKTASFSPASLSSRPTLQNDHPSLQFDHDIDMLQQQQQEDDVQLINREKVDSWTTGRQNSKVTVNFRKDSALPLIKQINKYKAQRQIQQRAEQEGRLLQQQEKDGIESDDENDIYVDPLNSNNIVYHPHHQDKILLLDNDDNPNNNHENNKFIPFPTTTTTTTTSTRSTTSYQQDSDIVPQPQLFNNSTFEFNFEPNFEIIGQTNEAGNKTNYVRLPGSSYNFKFLIDANSFKGSSDIGKALTESDNQHVEFISVLVQINKNKPM